MRNLLGDYHTICHIENGHLKQIMWQFIHSLKKLQEEIGFSFANKLQQKHLFWEKHKMNVKLAVHTLRASIANAIDFLHDEAQLPEFQDSEATSEFIRRIDLAFDMMNSRNPLAKGSKQPDTLEYFPRWARECNELSKHIFNLRTIDGDLPLKSNRKTVIWGFATSIQSGKAVVEELLQRIFFHTSL